MADTQRLIVAKKWSSAIEKKKKTRAPPLKGHKKVKVIHHHFLFWILHLSPLQCSPSSKKNPINIIFLQNNSTACTPRINTFLDCRSHKAPPSSRTPPPKPPPSETTLLAGCKHRAKFLLGTPGGVSDSESCDHQLHWGSRTKSNRKNRNHQAFCSSVFMTHLCFFVSLCLFYFFCDGHV